MKRIGVGIAAALMALAVGSPAAAQTDDEPTGPYPPTIPPYSLEIEAFGTFCLDDSPFINFDVTPDGFTPDPAQIEFRIFDDNGEELPAPYSPQVFDSFTGQFLYPGASEDPPDWPGWEEVPPGSGNWVDDTPGALEDAIWRDGLTIQITYLGSLPSTISGFRAPSSAFVQQTDPLVAFADVQYPPPTTKCANPPGVSPPPPPQTTTPSGTTPAGELPKTGGGFGLWRQALALIGAGGLLVLVATRRRHHEPTNASA